MFRGQFLHTIDSKGRISLPSRFRDVLVADEKLIVAPAPFEPCLHVYTLHDWEQFENRVAGLSNWDDNVTLFKRLYVSAAIECELDRSGRVLIPPHLRAKAELEKEVLWAGMGNNAEMWSKARWDQALSMTDERRDSFKKAVKETFGLC
jgi:MraZ protein